MLGCFVPFLHKGKTRQQDNRSEIQLCYSQEVTPAMQYQIFVENQSHQHFVASVIGMPTIAVDGGTEIEAISNAKAALKSQLAKGKIVTVDLDEIGKLDPQSTRSMQYTGIFENDLDFQAIVSEIAAERTSADDSEVDPSYYS
jgi:predicted RNase H-like HicB family nuclease